VTIDIDCTPEEARRFMGLPDVTAAQEAVVQEWQKQATEAMKAMDPQALFKAWVPDSGAWEQFQNAFWNSLGGQGGGQPPGGKK
jgi:hypothetical protein